VTKLVRIVALGMVAGLAAGEARADEAPAVEARADAPPASAPADAAAVQTIVHHVPPAEADEGQTLRLAAVVENAWAEKSLVVRFRPARAAADARWQEALFERSSTGLYYAAIPAAALARPGVAYYVVGVTSDGREVPHFASAASPHEVRVEPAAAVRWIEAERRRLAGRVDRFRLISDLVSFGDDLGGEQDWFVRSEVDWTHRLVTRLYSITLGFGFIEGRTASVRDEAMPRYEERGARYGFGELRLRASEILWIDAGVLLGFSHGGFAPGARGRLIIGRDWRTSVQLGAEYITDVGGTFWVQLQWDTVPPFLMWARVTSTELPGSALEGGAQLSLHADYPVTERFTIGATLSANARERRPAAPGLGLSASVEF
jgi:hypothetical protein